MPSTLTKNWKIASSERFSAPPLRVYWQIFLVKSFLLMAKGTKIRCRLFFLIVNSNEIFSNVQVWTNFFDSRVPKHPKRRYPVALKDAFSNVVAQNPLVNKTDVPRFGSVGASVLPMYITTAKNFGETRLSSQNSPFYTAQVFVTHLSNNPALFPGFVRTEIFFSVEFLLNFRTAKLCEKLFWYWNLSSL